MQKTDNNLLVLTGILIIALIAVEFMTPLENAAPTPAEGNPPAQPPTYKLPVMSSGVRIGATVISTHTLAMVQVKPA